MIHKSVLLYSKLAFMYGYRNVNFISFYHMPQTFFFRGKGKEVFILKCKNYSSSLPNQAVQPVGYPFLTWVPNGQVQEQLENTSRGGDWRNRETKTMRKKLALAPFGDCLPTRLRAARPWKPLEIRGAGKTKATPQLTHPRWCDHLPRVSPGEDCRVSLGGIFLQHWRPSHDPGPQPKPKQQRWRGTGDPQMFTSPAVCTDMWASTERRKEVRGKPLCGYHLQRLQSSMQLYLVLYCLPCITAYLYETETALLPKYAKDISSIFSTI